METENGTEPIVDTTSTEVVDTSGAPGPDSNAGETPAQQPTGINPAWAPIHEVLGDDVFSVHVQPHLQKFDEAAQSRITNLTSELKGFEGYKPFIDQGINPEQIEMAINLAKFIETNPQEFYSNLGKHLGIAVEEPAGETLEEFGAGQENAAAIPPDVMARIEAAEKFQKEFQERQEAEEAAKQQQAAVDEAGKQLDQEMSTFLKGNPAFTENDRAELFRLRHELTMQLRSQGLTRMASLEEAADAFNKRVEMYRQRATGAPATLPTTPGGDIPAQKPQVGSMSKEDMVALVANDLFAAKARQAS